MATTAQSSPHGGVGDAGPKLSALDELFYATTNYRKGAAFRALLDFCGRFRQYAPYNAFLLHMQKPGATFAATPGQWRKQFGREVKEGSRALVILAPMSPVLFMYDLDDTIGDPVPEDALRPFRTEGRVPPEVRTRTINNAARDHINIGVRDLGSSLAGRVYRRPRNRMATPANRPPVQAKFTIDLNQSHDETAQYVTLVHELAHIHCGHLGDDADGWWPDASHLGKESREFEAESVAYLVNTRLGINAGSARYLAGYLESSGQIPAISLERVLKAAGYIESLGKRALPPRLPRSVSQPNA